MLRKLQGIVLLQQKQKVERWDELRTLMAHISNWSGKTTKKGTHIKPADLIRLPGDKKKTTVKLDIKKLWKKHQENERSSGNN